MTRICIAFESTQTNLGFGKSNLKNLIYFLMNLFKFRKRRGINVWFNDISNSYQGRKFQKMSRFLRKNETAEEILIS